MKAVIFHTLSKNEFCKKIALNIHGDRYQIKFAKDPIKWMPLQVLVYGFQTLANRKVDIKPMEIDFDKYDEIVLVSPVWASRANAYMRQFLRDYPFTNKKVTIVGSCDGGYKGYFKSFNSLLDESNKVVDTMMYIKGVKEK